MGRIAQPRDGRDVAESGGDCGGDARAGVAGLVTQLAVDHVGVVVPTLAEGRRFFTADEPGLRVAVQFGRGAGGVVYELIAPLGEDSPVSGALRSGRNLQHPLADRTASLDGAARQLREQGCVETAAAHPALAYGGAPVQFFMSPLRILFEVIEAPEHQHVWSGAEAVR